MTSFNYKDLEYHVSQYFSNKNCYTVAITCEKSIDILCQPYNLVAFDDKGNTHGVLIMHYAEMLQELDEADTSLGATLAAQHTWVCLTKEMYDVCKQYIDEFTGVLFYNRASNDEYKIKVHKEAERMHEFTFTSDMNFELLKIQCEKYMHELNHQHKVKQVNRQS